MKNLDIVTFGEAMAMFIANEARPLEEVTQFTKAMAGAETNVAVGLARLGLKVGWVSKVGDDAFGKFIRQTLQNECVDISAVKTDGHHPTGFQMKSKVLYGDPEVQYFRKGSAASTLHPDHCATDYFLSAGHLHMTGIPLALSESTRNFSMKVLRVMKDAGKTVSFDPNLRPALWSSEREMIRVVNDAACQADWVLPGIDEGELLTGFTDPSAMADYYLERGVHCVVIKLGDKGAYFKTKDEEKTIPGFYVDHVVDTVGAGDGFAVGMISGLLEGLPGKEAVERGHAIGALAVQSPGDMDGLPNLDQLNNFIEVVQKVRET